MEDRYERKKEMADAIEEKHKAFLTELARMPVGRGEDRERRLRFFRQYPMRDDFQMEVMEAYEPAAYRRFRKRLTDPSGFGGVQDADMASAAHRQDIDTVIYVEAMNEAVCGYMGKNTSGAGYNFVACLGRNYKQMAARESAVNDLGETGISDTEIPTRNLPKVIHVVRDGKEMAQRERSGRTPEEILNATQEALGVKCTKKECELIRTLVFNTAFTVSLDAGTEDDETCKFQLADPHNAVREMEERETARDMFRIFCENIERKWALIHSAKGLREKKIIQMFFSANLLKELKLDDHGQPYSAEPAGNDKFYPIVEPQGDFLYRELLDREYLHRALEKYPRDFYEVYANLLRRDFKFEDTVIAELAGKDKSTISRARKKYVELVRALCDFS